MFFFFYKYKSEIGDMHFISLVEPYASEDTLRVKETCNPFSIWIQLLCKGLWALIEKKTNNFVEINEFSKQLRVRVQ